MSNNVHEIVRAFIAIEIPAARQQQIAAACTPLHALPDRITWVKPQNLHLSLRFLGEIDIGRLPKLKLAISKVTGDLAPFPIDFTDLGSFPDKKRPRVIWLGLNDSTARLSKLKQELDSELRACGFAPDKRVFKPHLTLGRIRKLLDGKRLSSALHSLSLPELAPLRVAHISLMRSRLHPQGPIYTELDKACFGGS